MNHETELKTELVRQCRKLGWYARRIEDQYAVGILDIIIVPPNHFTLFVEAKITDGLKFAPTPRQYVEGLEIIKASGCAFPVIIGWRQEIMYIGDWAHEAFITKAYRQPDGMNYAETIKEWISGRNQRTIASPWT